MAHLFQVGSGSGGMPVLDMVARDPRITEVTLVEPDVFKPHNVHRHHFAAGDVGRGKADLAAEWLQARRADLRVHLLPVDLLDPAQADVLDRAAAGCDLGICAADSEAAKYHFDQLMRRHGKPWTLGEVLSGGIGGFVHWFRPGGPCYGCVASHLKRSATTDRPPTPDYSAPGGPVHETTLPASKASIGVIAGLHAQLTLRLLDDPGGFDPGFVSLLFTLEKVPGVFEEAYRPFRFRIARAEGCLLCGVRPPAPADLDRALEDALDRLG